MVYHGTSSKLAVGSGALALACFFSKEKLSTGLLGLPEVSFFQALTR
jgi:hypothetical protein